MVCSFRLAYMSTAAASAEPPTGALSASEAATWTALMRQMTERRLSGVLGGRFKRSDIRAIDLYASTIRCMG
jgi:hypothetical protein